jgi:hypothetical protein
MIVWDALLTYFVFTGEHVKIYATAALALAFFFRKE